MSHLVRRTLCVATVGLALSWLMLAGGSPLSNRIADQPIATNVASAINLPTVLFAIAGLPGARPPESAVVVVATLQWVVYGYILAGLWRKLRPDGSSRPDCGSARCRS